MRTWWTIALTLAALSGAPPLAAALTPAERCQSAKLKVAGKYGFCRLKAESQAVKTGDAPDYSKCDGKFADKWSLAETAASGACATSGDQAAIGGFIGQHTDDLAAALAGGPLPDCPADLATCSAELSTCEAALTAAELCGDAVIDAGEDCDQGNLGGETCVTLGFFSGTLACGAGCVFNTGACVNARFVDNADGTITDNLTGLMWEKRVELNTVTNPANLHDADNVQPWAGDCPLAPGTVFCQPTAAAAALCAANASGDTMACGQCTAGQGTCDAATTIWTVAVELNAAAFAGHTDWRPATLAELVALFDNDDMTSPYIDVAFHGPSCGAGCTDIASAACSCTVDGGTWTASADGPINAWFVDFGGPFTNFTGKQGNLHARFVRTGP
jgi:hypothetical protein